MAKVPGTQKRIRWSRVGWGVRGRVVRGLEWGNSSHKETVFKWRWCWASHGHRGDRDTLDSAHKQPQRGSIAQCLHATPFSLEFTGQRGQVVAKRRSSDTAGTVFRDPKGHIQNCSANLYLNLVKHQIFNFRLINIKYWPQVYISAHAHTHKHTHTYTHTYALGL